MTVLADLASWRRHRSPRTRWHPDRPWWRRLLAAPTGPCWHITHAPERCDATWQLEDR